MNNFDNIFLQCNNGVNNGGRSFDDSQNRAALLFLNENLNDNQCCLEQMNDTIRIMDNNNVQSLRAVEFLLNGNNGNNGFCNCCRRNG